MSLFNHLRVPVPKATRWKRYQRVKQPNGAILLFWVTKTQIANGGGYLRGGWRKSLGKIVQDDQGNECLIPSEFYFLHTNQAVPEPETVEDARRPEQQEHQQRDVDPRAAVPTELQQLQDLGLIRQ